MSSSSDSESSEHEISAPRYEIPRSLQQNLSHITRLQACGLRPSHDASQTQWKIVNPSPMSGGQQTQEQTLQQSRSASHDALQTQWKIFNPFPMSGGQQTQWKIVNPSPMSGGQQTQWKIVNPSPMSGGQQTQWKIVNPSPMSGGQQTQWKIANPSPMSGGQPTQGQTSQLVRSASHIAVYKQTNTQKVLHWLQTNHWSQQEEFRCQSPLEELRCQSACQISNRKETNSNKYSNPDRIQKLAFSQNQPDQTLYEALQLKHYRSLLQRDKSYKLQQPVEFSVKGLSPVPLENGFDKHGCLYIDLVFPKPSKVAEVRFHNHYTAAITVFVREHRASDGGKSEWIRSIARKVLMPRPAYVDGGEDLVSVTADESETDWSSLWDMRLVLRQPSARWRMFYVEKLSVFSELQPPVWTLFTHADGRTENAFLTLLQLQTDEAVASGAYEFDTLPENDESSDDDTE